MSNDDVVIIKDLQAQHIRHASTITLKAQMDPGSEEEIDFFRTDSTCELVGAFQAKDEGNKNNDDADIENQQPMGFIGLLYDEDKAFVVLLVVDERFRKRGLGEKLVKWAIEQVSRRRGRHLHHTGTDPKLLQLVASKLGSPLYKKLGFKEAGHSTLYTINLKVGEHATKKHKQIDCLVDEESKEQIIVESSKVADIAQDSGVKGFLWNQAMEMTVQATNSTIRKHRLQSLLVRKATAHLLYNDMDKRHPKLQAWGSLRRFSRTGLIIGPLYALSIDDAIQLINTIVARQQVTEDVDTLVICTDPSTRDNLCPLLASQGWQEKATLEVLQRNLDPSVQANQTILPLGGAKQYALTDFSHQ